MNRFESPRAIFQKENAIITSDVLWNGQSLRQQEMEENLKHIKEYNIQTICRGYLCSSCDPFLLLICQIYPY